MRDDLMRLSLAEAQASGWPSIHRERPMDREPSSLGDLIRLMRNALAHGNIEFLSDGKGQIHAIRLWNMDSRPLRRTWGAMVKVQDMRCFLDMFVRLIEHRHRDFGWYARGAA
jgi:hypothetical protein